MQLPDLMKIIKKNFKKTQQNALPNGLLCLKEATQRRAQELQSGG